MVVLKKGEATKILSPESSLIEKLKFEGWAVDGEEVKVEAVKVAVDVDLDALRAEAEALGLKVHHKAGADKIREMIAEAKEVE